MYLCRSCGGELRRNLEQIPWLADRLAEAHVKQIAPGEVATVQREMANEDDEESPVPFNRAAFHTYDELRSVCMRWVRDLCDQEGIEFWPLDAVPANFIGPLRPEVPARNLERIPPVPGQWRMHSGYVPTISDLARWLVANYLAIVNSEDAELCYREIDAAVRKGFRTLNPPRREFCGRCKTVVGKNDRGEPIRCGVDIEAEWDDNEGRMQTFVECHKCKTTYESTAFQRQSLLDAEEALMTKSEILEFFARFDNPLSPNTFKMWRKRRRLEPRGWLHDGRITNYWIHRNDPPVFRFGDVQRLRLRPQVESEAKV